MSRWKWHLFVGHLLLQVDVTGFQCTHHRKNQSKSSTKILYAEGDVEENTQQDGHILNSMLSAGQK
jgi:uncharacterized alpha/beta hydrolase family protein